MPYFPRDMLPECLHGLDFPWGDQLYMFDYTVGHSCRPSPYIVTRIQLWLPMPNMTGPSSGGAIGYWNEASRRHAQVWRWFEDHFVLADVPELELQGSALWYSDRPQEYARLLALGTYHLGPRRLTASEPSSSGSSTS